MGGYGKVGEGLGVVVREWDGVVNLRNIELILLSLRFVIYFNFEKKILIIMMVICGIYVFWILIKFFLS